MDPASLTCYKSPFPKKRLGRDYDGGYIICDINGVKYDCLLSGGIQDDISFEEDFCKLYTDVKCLAYDGTINSIETGEKNIEFIKKNIGGEETENVSNLHSVISKFESIFVKMDIEGGEVGWLKSLTSEHMNKFIQIVMEFHFPFGENEVGLFEKINETHVLVHLHANNCCGVRDHRGVIVPNIFECTYLHKRFMKEPYELNKEFIPSPIDMRNLTCNPEIELNHPPFVNN